MSGAIVLTDEEKKEFTKGAIEALNDPSNLAQFENDIENIGTTAVQIDQAFDRVSRGFKDMVDNHGSDFPEVAGYRSEWDGYKKVGAIVFELHDFHAKSISFQRWVQYLWQSRDVASEMTAVLRRMCCDIPNADPN